MNLFCSLRGVRNVSGVCESEHVWGECDKSHSRNRAPSQNKNQPELSSNKMAAQAGLFYVVLTFLRTHKYSSTSISSSSTKTSTKQCMKKSCGNASMIGSVRASKIQASLLKKTPWNATNKRSKFMNITVKATNGAATIRRKGFSMRQ